RSASPGHPPECPSYRNKIRDGAPVQPAIAGGATLVAPATPWWHGPAGLICHALPATAALYLSPFVAWDAAPCCNACTLQPLEKTARNKNPAGWHRFCLLLAGRESRGLGESRQHSCGRQGPLGWEYGLACRSIPARVRGGQPPDAGRPWAAAHRWPRGIMR